MSLVGQLRFGGQIQNRGEIGLHLCGGVFSIDDDFYAITVRLTIFIVKEPTVLIQFPCTTPE